MLNEKHTIKGLLVFAILAFGAGTLLADYVASKAEEDRPLAIVRRFKPDVIVKHADADEWEDSEIGKPLFNNDTLRTDENGYAAVQFMDNSLLKIKPNSLLIIKGEVLGKNSTASRLAVEIGEVFLNVTKRQSDFEVQTPTGVASVKGTSFGTLVGKDGSSQFLIYTGLVELKALISGQTVELTRGKKASVDKEGNNINITELSDDEMEKNQQDYDNLEKGAKPKTLRLQFKNEAGQIREIEIQYFEN